MSKILLYSDCFVFSGSENVIENILLADDIRKDFRLTFYFAYNKEYEKGVQRKFKNDPGIRPVKRLLNLYSELGQPLAAGKVKGWAKRSFLHGLYILGLGLHKIGLIPLYNGYLLYRIFKKEKPDIVLINNGGYPGAESCRTAVISARLAGVRKQVFIVNNLAYPPKNFLDRYLDRFIGKYVNYFVTASKAASKRLTAVRNFDAAKCIDIPNTLTNESENKVIDDTSLLHKEFGFTVNTIVLGAAGLLTKRKGYHVLIEAMADLVKRSGASDFKLVIIGEGEERPALEAQIVALGLQEKVYLPGFRSNVMEYLNGIDVFIAPSIANEDFPYVVIEAMSLGKPVIGTEIAGIPEQIDHGKTGYVVVPGNPEDLSDAILRLSDREKVKVAGEASRQRYFSLFSNKIAMKRYLDLFHSL